MAEKKIVIPSQVISYSGIFSVSDIYSHIDSFTRQNGYDKLELLNSEQVFSSGKDIVLLIEPYKKITDYAKCVLWVKMIFTDVKEVEIERDGKKKKMNKGNVTIIMQGFLITDYEGKWEQQPWFIFIRTIFDKFVFKIYTNKFEEILRHDYQTLNTHLKGYLNLQKKL